MDFAGQNRNDAAVASVRRPSPENSRSPGRAESGVSVLARRIFDPPELSTRPTGSSAQAGARRASAMTANFGMYRSELGSSIDGNRRGLAFDGRGGEISGCNGGAQQRLSCATHQQAGLVLLIQTFDPGGEIHGIAQNGIF